MGKLATTARRSGLSLSLVRHDVGTNVTAILDYARKGKPVMIGFGLSSPAPLAHLVSVDNAILRGGLLTTQARARTADAKVAFGAESLEDRFQRNNATRLQNLAPRNLKPLQVWLDDCPLNVTPAEVKAIKVWMKAAR